MVTHRAAQDRMAHLELVKHRPERCRAGDLEQHLALHLGQRPEMRRERDPDHGSVCSSTDCTVGRSRTIGVQVSPASAEQYTCPAVVPK